MEILLAEDMGFCFGVRRAVEVMNQAAHEGGLLESLGTVVHNPQVVEKMARQGIEVIADLDEVKGETVAITAHGVGPQVLEGLRTRDFRAEICSDIGTETYHIERAVDIYPSWIKDKERVGITAGASTPDEAIEEMISYLRSMAEKSPSK